MNGKGLPLKFEGETVRQSKTKEGLPVKSMSCDRPKEWNERNEFLVPIPIFPDRRTYHQPIPRFVTKTAPFFFIVSSQSLLFVHDKIQSHLYKINYWAKNVVSSYVLNEISLNYTPFAVWFSSCLISSSILTSDFPSLFLFMQTEVTTGEAPSRGRRFFSPHHPELSSDSSYRSSSATRTTGTSGSSFLSSSSTLTNSSNYSQTNYRSTTSSSPFKYSRSWRN